MPIKWFMREFGDPLKKTERQKLKNSPRHSPICNQRERAPQREAIHLDEDETPSSSQESYSRHLARFDWFILTPLYFTLFISTIGGYVLRQWLFGSMLLVTGFLVSIIAGSFSTQEPFQGRPRLEDALLNDGRQVTLLESLKIGKAVGRLAFIFGMATFACAFDAWHSWSYALTWGFGVFMLASGVILIGFAFSSMFLDSLRNQRQTVALCGSLGGFVISVCVTILILSPILIKSIQ